MTAVIHHGPPGSFKSFGVLQDEAIPALLAGRTVVTNVRGLNSIEQIELALDVEIPEEAELISVPHDSEGFKTMAVWYHWAPKGALIFMDEGQRIYPTRLRDLSSFDYPGGQLQAEMDERPANLENAFDQHRHHNWDIYITTTNIAKIHKEIRQVAEYGFRHRNLTGLLPWYKNKWKEVRHDPSTSGQSATSCIGQPIIKKAKTKYFGCYESTQTGKATNDIKNPAIFKQPKIIMFAVVILVAIVFQGWFWFVDEPSTAGVIDPGQSVQVYSADPAPSLDPPRDGGSRVDSNTPDIRAAPSVDFMRHPVMVQRGQYLGTIDDRYKRNHIFRFYDDDGHYYQVTSKELKQHGFTVNATGCVARIEYQGQYRFIHCYNQLTPQLDKNLADNPSGSEFSPSQEQLSRVEWLERQTVIHRF